MPQAAVQQIDLYLPLWAWMLSKEIHITGLAPVQQLRPLKPPEPAEKDFHQAAGTSVAKAFQPV